MSVVGEIYSMHNCTGRTLRTEIAMALDVHTRLWCSTMISKALEDFLSSTARI